MQLFKYLKNILYGKKIIVGMGAGNISNWMWEIPSQIR
jgi:UDP-N-acetylmuramate--alanine ligase